MGSHGMQLNFQQFNEAAGQVPLLMLHGLFGDQSNWRSQAWLLSKDHWVITTDLRNHGHSFHDPKMDYFTMASDVQKFIAISASVKSRFIRSFDGWKGSHAIGIQPASIDSQLNRMRHSTG